MALVAFGNADPNSKQVQRLADEKRRHPQNKLANYNKLLNRYTVMLKGGKIQDSYTGKELERQNLGRALARNNRWCNKLLENFYRLDHKDEPVKCSTWFHQNRRRRSTNDAPLVNLADDEWTALEECDMKALDFEDAEDGETCEDCCKMGDDGEWILEGNKKRGKLNEQPADMAKAMRRVIGAIKKWGNKFISDCGGQPEIAAGNRSPHYTVLRRLLKAGIKNDSEDSSSDKSLTNKILNLKWKRVFPASKSVQHGDRTKKVHFKHSQFHEDLGITEV